MKRKWIIVLILMGVAFSLMAGEAVESKYKINVYGFVKLEAIYDNTEVAKGDWLLFVRPGDSPQADQSVYTMNARHSRIGMKFQGPTILEDGKVNALIEADFAGGFPNSSTAARQPLLRLRHAWVEIDKPMWALRFGQDWALISGPFPNTTSFVVGAGKGNLWMRYSQIKYTLKMKPVKLALSINRPMAGNIKYDNYAGGSFDIVGDGEKSGMPWFMGRVWLNTGKATLSLSGHYGQEQINDLSDVAHDMKSYSVNADVVLPVGPMTLTARGFMGENLNSFFGGVFQGFTKDASSVTNVAAKGGWGQIQYKLSNTWALTAGGGMDDPDDADLTSGMRSKNTWLFGNAAMTLHPSLVFMLEAESLKTSYLDGEDGDNLRIQFVTYFKF